MSMGMGMHMGMGMGPPMGMGPMNIPAMAMGPMGMPMPLIPGTTAKLAPLTHHLLAGKCGSL